MITNAAAMLTYIRPKTPTQEIQARHGARSPYAKEATRPSWTADRVEPLTPRLVVCDGIEPSGQ